MSIYREPMPRAPRKKYRAPTIRARYWPRLRDIMRGRLEKRAETLRTAIERGFVPIDPDVVPSLREWLENLDALADLPIAAWGFADHQRRRGDRSLRRFSWRSR
jgi:hypothetical protein